MHTARCLKSAFSYIFWYELLARPCHFILVLVFVKRTFTCRHRTQTDSSSQCHGFYGHILIVSLSSASSHYFLPFHAWNTTAAFLHCIQSFVTGSASCQLCHQLVFFFSLQVWCSEMLRTGLIAMTSSAKGKCSLIFLHSRC